MQRLGVAAMVAVMAVMGTGCVYSGALTLSEQDKKVVSKTIPVKQFDHLDVATGINVTYTPGATREMKVTAPACLMERLEVKQEGGKLKLKLKSCQGKDVSSFSDLLRKLKSEDGVKVQLSSPSLKEIETSSGASVKAVSLPNVYELEFSASSGSEIEIGSLEAGKIRGRCLEWSGYQGEGRQSKRYGCRRIEWRRDKDKRYKGRESGGRCLERS